ncbi:MAG TPA: hypothetical protein DDY78_15320 [Planctomycetales bacterium]|jgi:hypothetical protein|nr:hypothetical protein [Planctomycetales bacterium]
MAFGNFKSGEDVAAAYQISVAVDSFLQPIAFPVDERFESELAFALKNIAVRMSEASICEFLIAPVLKTVWKPYSESLLIWSHIPLGAKAPLVGTPDYFFTRRSPLGLIPNQPYVLVVEAKKDDFEAGWGQCLAAMLAAQNMNDHPTRTIYGCVSNGSLWQFGKLEGRSFTREIREYVLSDLPDLFAAWNYVFAQAKEQALAPAA